MDESDDDFKELCATFLQRVKKNGTKEVSRERKTQKASNSTETSKPKRTKPTATKSKTLQGPREKKTRSGSQGPRTKRQGASKWQESKPAPPENGGGGVPASAVLQENVQNTQTGNWARATGSTFPERQPEMTVLFYTRSQKTSCKGPDSKLLWLCSHGLCCNFSTP